VPLTFEHPREADELTVQFVAIPADRTVIRTSLQPLSPGIYIVEWRALTADTHRTEGAFIFHVGQ
jgi:methionine-rich copper-binding protein CopC